MASRPAFDDPHLVSCAGLAPVLELAERAGLQDLVGEHVRIDKPGGANAHLKVAALVAGMSAGPDSIDDMDLLRHGAISRLFTEAGLLRRSGRSCAPSRSVMSGSSTRWPRG